MRSILQIFDIFTPKQLRYCAFIVFTMVIGAMLEAVGIGAIMPLISIMGQPDFLQQHAEIANAASDIGITTHTGFIAISSILLIVLYLCKNIYMAWQMKLQIDFSLQNQVEFSKRLMENYLIKPYAFYLNHNSATLLRNVHDAGNIIFSSMMVYTFALITEIVTVAIIWGMLVIVDAFTAVVIAGVMAAMLCVIIKSFRKHVARQGIIKNQYSRIYIKWLNQALGSIKETKVMRKEAAFLHEFSEAYRQYGAANRKYLFINQLPRMMIEALVVSGLLVLIIVKLYMGSAPMDIVPLLGVLALAAFRLMPSANRIVSTYNAIKFQQPLFYELYPELIEIKYRRVEKQDSYYLSMQPKMPFRGKIQVNNLHFAYPEGKGEVLCGVSFEINKGDFVGIIGASGAGKTTFVDILLGLFRPTEGNIKVDEQDIFENIRSWQANIAYVPQGTYLIDGTVRENIALGESPEKINDEMVKKSLEMAELYDFVIEMTDGLETVVGERGVKLSGGQRQRIGIARALYQQPEVLILDEATSALDNETEKSITDTILKFKGQITIIAIAHRMSTLTECDYKIEFINGKARRLEDV